MTVEVPLKQNVLKSDHDTLCHISKLQTMFLCKLGPFLPPICHILVVTFGIVTSVAQVRVHHIMNCIKGDANK